jgi:hypothetical protein
MGTKTSIWILAAIGGILVYLWYKKSKTPAATLIAPGLTLKPRIGAKQNPLLCTIAKLLGKKCSPAKSAGGSGGGSAPGKCSAGSGPAAGTRACCKSPGACCYCPCVPGSLPLAPTGATGAQLNGLCAPACPQCGIAGCCNLVASATTACCGFGSTACGGGSVGGCFCCSGCWFACPACV